MGFCRGKGTGPISIIGAEELAGLEGYIASTGESALDVIRGWKSSARTGDIYLKNYLSNASASRSRGPELRCMFQALMRRSHRLLFGSEPPPGNEEAMFSEDPPPPTKGNPDLPPAPEEAENHVDDFLWVWTSRWEISTSRGGFLIRLGFAGARFRCR